MKQYQNPIRLPEPETIGKENVWAKVGDPFVYRFNGRYYLYPSAGAEGIEVWESEDLTDWQYIGIVADDPILGYAYAPEIFYFNGVFYLITSPRGEGHYIYTSCNPTGPFERLTDNFGQTIDGSIFADDDGSLYLFRAGNPSIYAHKLERDGTIHEAHELFGTSMGHWTEGPGVFKRAGRYYITMTGNHLLSRGYRIDYAISEDGPLGPWMVPRNKTIVVNSDYENGSLGHSSSVIGPDLDSYWIFYHSYPVDRMEKRNGRNSRMDRMLFPGDELVVSGPSQSECPAPPHADFYGWTDNADYGDKFQYESGRILSCEALRQIGTAEVTLIPGNEGKALFGYRDEQEYVSISCVKEHFMVYVVNEDGQECLLDSKLYEGFRTDVLHSLRVEFAPEETRFFIDLMMQGKTKALDGTGRIGTQNAQCTSYVAFHGQVGQSSDRLHYNNIPGKAFALLAMPGSDGKVFRCADGQQHLMLREGEQIRLRLNVEQAGEYHIQILAQAFEDTKVECGFCTGECGMKLARMESMRRLELGRVILEAGIQECNLIIKEGEVLLHSMELFPAIEPEQGEYSGLELCHKADQIEGDICIDRVEGMQMDRKGHVLSRFGERFHADGFIEADILFYEFDSDNPSGLFLRVSEDSSYYEQVAVGHRGYFVGFDGNEMFIWRMDFGKKELWRQRCFLLPWKEYCIRVEIWGGSISVWVNGQRLVTVMENEPFPYGRAGVGSFGARTLVKRIQYELR